MNWQVAKKAVEILNERWDADFTEAALKTLAEGGFLERGKNGIDCPFLKDAHKTGQFVYDVDSYQPGNAAKIIKRHKSKRATKDPKALTSQEKKRLEPVTVDELQFSAYTMIVNLGQYSNIQELEDAKDRWEDAVKNAKTLGELQDAENQLGYKRPTGDDFKRPSQITNQYLRRRAAKAAGFDIDQFDHIMERISKVVKRPLSSQPRKKGGNRGKR